MVKTIDRGTFHRRSIRQGTRDRQERYLGLVECVLQDAGWPFTDPDKGSLVVSFHDPVRLLEAVWTVDIHGMECSDDRAEIKRPALWVRKSLVTKESRNGQLKDRIPRRLRRVCRGSGTAPLVFCRRLVGIILGPSNAGTRPVDGWNSDAQYDRNRNSGD